jgi:hypothetical protein
MAYNLKEHIAAQNEFVEAVDNADYFNDFIAARDPIKGIIHEQEFEQEEEEEFVEDYDDYD